MIGMIRRRGSEAAGGFTCMRIGDKAAGRCLGGAVVVYGVCSKAKGIYGLEENRDSARWACMRQASNSKTSFEELRTDAVIDLPGLDIHCSKRTLLFVKS